MVRFTAEDDAVRWANDTEFGLVSYVYTRDLSRGLRVSEALEAGMVGLNRGIVSDPAAPFGGVKQSGIGREGAHEGLLEFTETSQARPGSECTTTQIARTTSPVLLRYSCGVEESNAIESRGPSS